MWRKRSIKSRYWNIKRRLRFIPGLAALALAGCASNAVPTSSPPDAVRITSCKPAARPEKKPENSALDPCSEWVSLVPMCVEEGKPFRTRRVRNLC